MPMTSWTSEVNQIGAQGAAWQLHQRYAITEPYEIDVNRIAMARGVYISLEDATGADAWLVRGKKYGIVRFNSTIDRGRQRFAIAHELGHWELHRTESQASLCREADLRDYKKSPMEIEANLFAAEFLMPANMFRAHCRTESPSLPLIKRLAETYSTSLTATGMRYVDLAKYTCLVAFSENGRVRFWRGQKESEYYLPKQCALHAESLAWQCSMNGLNQSDMSEVPSSAWFSHLHDCDDIVVHEQSMKLGSYGVMSLLWIRN